MLGLGDLAANKEEDIQHLQMYEDPRQRTTNETFLEAQYERNFEDTRKYFENI